MPKPTPQPVDVPAIVSVTKNSTPVYVQLANRTLDSQVLTPDIAKRYEVSLDATIDFDSAGHYMLVWNDGGNEQHLIATIDIVAGQQHIMNRVILAPGELPAEPVIFGIISFTSNMTLSPNSRLCQLSVIEWPA